MAHSFEELRASIEQLPSSPEADARHVFWVVPFSLGVAADARGGREVFLIGSALRTRSMVVARHLQHGSWRNSDGDEFEASRLVLPPAPHFLALSALIASEMLRFGLAGGCTIQEAFSAVEPLVELSLKRAQLSEEAVRGLLGELIVLDQMLVSVADHPEYRSAVLDMWRGHQHAARDFRVGKAAVEVKTTCLRSSIHHINSLSQVEPQSTENDVESELFLLSVGLAPSEAGSLSVPSLVERIYGRLATEGFEPSPLQIRFLHDVRHYGSADGTGYNHPTMSGVPAYSARYSTTFEPRFFDACDPDFRVIRRSMLTSTFVSAEDISFKVVLPDALNEHNPVREWRHAILTLTRGALNL
jgi:hypothetical protein